MMMANQPRRGPSRWHFDIDRYLNPLFPASILPRFPAPVAHFLGYRTHPPHPLGNLAMIFWAAVGVFSSIAVIGAVAQGIPEFQGRGVPVVIGSFVCTCYPLLLQLITSPSPPLGYLLTRIQGAAAVLDFYAIESPLAQPRNAILGQMVSAVVGVGICKLFALSPHFHAVRWLGASLSCACATALMALTGTVHPPAGATALMAVVDEDVSKLGWFLLVPLLLGCVLMLAVALLVNNIQRRFPYYWWSPQETGMFWRREIETEEPEAGLGEGKRPGRTGSVGGVSSRRNRIEMKQDESTSSSGDLELGGELARLVSVMSGREGEIVIRRGKVKIPEGLSLRPEEILSLETLSERL